MDFGKLTLSESALANLYALGFTADELQDAIHAHEANPKRDVPAVYVGTYHKYNCGSLRGMWVDVTSFDTYAEFQNFCRAIHCDEEDPEIMIQDFQNCGNDFRSEFFEEQDFEWTNLYWELCERAGVEAVEDFLEFFDDSQLEEFDEKFIGNFSNPTEFACYWVEMTGKQDEIEKLLPWLDYSGMAENMFAYDFHQGSNGNVFYC